MPFAADDWPHSMRGWDADRLARHAAHAARFVAAGWLESTSSLLAHDMVIDEDEAAKAEVIARRVERAREIRRRWDRQESTSKRSPSG
jgi:hypothetical protein